MTKHETVPASDTHVVPFRPWQLSIPVSGDPSDAAAGIAESLSRASTMEELLDGPPAAHGLAEYTGRPITVLGARLAQGEIDGEPTAYAIIDAIDNSTGERVALTTGAAGVMRQLARAYELDGYPFQAMPYEVQTGTKGRNNPLYLGKPDRF
jgi:hypothetical protein